MQRTLRIDKRTEGHVTDIVNKTAFFSLTPTLLRHLRRAVQSGPVQVLLTKAVAGVTHPRPPILAACEAFL